MVNITEEITLKNLMIIKKIFLKFNTLSSTYSEKVNTDDPTRLWGIPVLHMDLYVSSNAKASDGINLNHSSIP